MALHNPRTLFAWVFVALLITAGIFFTYHIVDAASQPSEPNFNGFNEINPILPKNSLYENPVNTTKGQDNDFALHAEPLDLPPEPPQRMPVVIGQTEEDLRATRQVIETPPPIEYPEPEAKDPMETAVNSESEFGDNLRHPEQTIEIHPPMGSMRVMPSGMGSEEPPSLGGHDSVQYAPELAQNGGEFMSGIFAFDSSDGGGVGFSMI
jgi:hypothetical protein